MDLDTDMVLGVRPDADLLIIMGRRSYLARATPGSRFHTDLGYIEMSDLIGKPYGTELKTSTGQSFLVLRPAFRDYTEKLSRTTQLIYPKDAGAILVWADIREGKRVLEAGTGSGALTCYLAAAVGESGHVFGFDVRQSSIERTRENLRMRGLENRVTLELCDVTQGAKQNQLDALVLDMPSPWLGVTSLKGNLRPDGHFLAFVPTMNQVERTVGALLQAGYVRVEAFELIQRFMDAKPNATRPKTSGVFHTGYIISGRNTLLDRPFLPPSPPRPLANETVTSQDFFDSLDKPG